MSSPTDASNKQNKRNGRSPFLFFGGAILLGLAAALLLFGGNFLAGNEAQGGDTAVLQQLPAPSGTSIVAEMPVSSIDLLAVGDSAHNFYLPDLDGNIVDLESFRGQPVIVNFWATWCAPCRVEMPALQAAYEAHQENDLVILAVNSQESHQDVTDFFAELGLTFTPLLDYEGEISNLYHVFNFPSTYFIDGTGRVTAVHRGLLSSEQIESYLAATLNSPN